MDYNNDFNQYYQPAGTVQQQEPVSLYTAKTFGWMFLGLLVTFCVALANLQTGVFFYVLYQVPYAIYILAIAELAVVLFLSARIQKLSVGTARALFLFYAVLNGFVFSTYFFLYDVLALILVFGATSLFFGIMAVAGYVTKADLSSLRGFLSGALLFLVAFWLIGIFINLQRFELIMCTIGVFIFLIFTAYDTQKIKAYHQYYANDPAMAKKASVFAALQLYLDFINLFIYLLRIIGKKK
ncbi:MAG: Bax inhibitor-1/YccA family protein [Lachnospiraceae bacterium]